MKVQLTIIKATRIPKALFSRTPSYYAAITVGAETRGTTKTIKGANPTWGEPFIIEIRPSDILWIQVFRSRNNGKRPEIVGKVRVNTEPYEKSGFQSIDNESHDLLSPGSSTKTGAEIVISVSTIANEQLSSPPGSSLVDHHQKQLEASAAILHNRTWTPASQRLNEVMHFLKTFVQIGASVAEVHPYAKLAWKLLTVGYVVLQAQLDRDQNIQALWTIVLDTLDFMREAEPLAAVKGLEITTQAIMKQIYDCALFLQKYGDRSLASHTLRDTLANTTDDAIKQFTRAFVELKTRFRDRINLDSWKMAKSLKGDVLQLVTVLDEMKEITQDERLEILPGAKLNAVQWNPDHTCLPGTREKLIDDILSWVHTGSDRILWLSGAAGTGKSSVANSVAQQLDSLGRLGASFCFNQGVITLDAPGYLFGNLSHQLALFDGQFRTALLAIIHRYGSGNALSLRNQAKSYMVEPFRSTNIIGPIVIVIDALDEYIQDKRKPSRASVVQAIVEEFPSLPSDVKVLITSRAEGSIQHLMPRCLSCWQLAITNVDGTQEDILKFVQYRLQQVRQFHGDLSDIWPGSDLESKLALAAEGLFIWADIACSFIEHGDDPHVQLLELLTKSNEPLSADTKLDQLFLNVLKKSLTPDQGMKVNNWHYVLDSIVALKIPLSRKAIDTLLGLSAESPVITLFNGQTIKLTNSYNIIVSLLPILRTDIDLAGPIQILHKSVFDFLTERAEAPYWVDLKTQNIILAIRCLEQMNQHLHYDICGLGTSSSYDSEVSDLPLKVQNMIPEVLQYSSIYFVYHLNMGNDQNASLLENLHIFVMQKLLYWIEVMNLLKKLHEAEASLNILHGYLTENNLGGPDMVEMVDNAISLIRHCGRPISLSTLHIYTTGVSLAPKTSVLYRVYSHLEGLPQAKLTVPSWTNSWRILEGHQYKVNSVAFSPDSKQLASGSSDDRILLWDVESSGFGTILEGHIKAVELVLFSPDGTKLISAASDTLKVWELGIQKHTLQGHKAMISSIAFAADKTTLISMSVDKHVFWWDIETGNMISSIMIEGTRYSRPANISPTGKSIAYASDGYIIKIWDIVNAVDVATFKGHTETIKSAAFSPDEKMLASTSVDRTVRFWDIDKQIEIGPSISTDVTGVNSIAFSPDGKTIAFGSNTIIQIWSCESHDNKVMLKKLQGHSSGITSVAFSPDGQRLASASWDSTVHLWDVTSTSYADTTNDGSSVHGIHCVAFSPDGKKVASGSFDNMVCLWDVATGELMGSVLEVHSKSVTMVAFSPSGEKLASCSWDNTVCLWTIDFQTMNIDNCVFEGHTHGVMSVDFSPDSLKLASASADSTVKLWNTKTETMIFSFEGQQGMLTSAIFSPNGKTLASISYTRNFVDVWDIETYTLLASLKQVHTPGLVVFSSENNILATTTQDGIHFWDIGMARTIGSPLVSPHGTPHPDTVIFSVDGKFLLSGSNSDKYVCLWSVETQTVLGSASESGYNGDKTHQILWDNPITQAMTVGALSYFDQDGFLTIGGKRRILWLPVHLRGRIHVGPDCTLAVCGPSGSLTFIDNTSPNL